MKPENFLENCNLLKLVQLEKEKTIKIQNKQFELSHQKTHQNQMALQEVPKNMKEQKIPVTN